MIICGIDEAGRGCLAGSLFVAGVVCNEAVLKNGLEKELLQIGIKDSKKLSKTTRYKLESKLNEIAQLRHFVIEKSATEIDGKGLSVCLKEALERIMQEVIKMACKRDKSAQNLQNPQIITQVQNPQNLQEIQNPKSTNPQEIRFYFDGNSAFGASVASAINSVNIAMCHINATLECIIKGDEKIALISCASIYAKCAKDTQSTNLAKIYPQYDLAKNAGYGTKSHINAILKYGISPIHRASFCAKLASVGNLVDFKADFNNVDFSQNSCIADFQHTKSKQSKSSNKNQPSLF